MIETNKTYTCKRPILAYTQFIGLCLCCVLIAFFASCSSDDIEMPDNPELPKAIEFGKVKTRAEVNAAEDIKNFSVFAERTSADVTTEVFTNERVYRDDDDDLVYDNKRYWAQASVYNFFAVHPYMANGIQRTTFTQGVNTYSGYTVSFSTPVNADTDLMTAYRGIDTADGYPASVDMSFQHLLSMVSFSIKKDVNNTSDEFVVNQITIKGVKSRGTLNTSPHASYTDNWSLRNATMQVTRSNLNATIGTGYTRVFGDENKGFLLLPQTASGLTLKVDYQYKLNGSDETLRTSVEVPLPEKDGEDKQISWIASNRINYKLTLSVDNNIYFSTPTIEPWGVMQSGGTIIIK